MKKISFIKIQPEEINLEECDDIIFWAVFKTFYDRQIKKWKGNKNSLAQKIFDSNAFINAVRREIKAERRSTNAT